MNKELQALERIKNIPILSTPESTQKIFYDKHKKELDIIETALKSIGCVDFEKLSEWLEKHNFNSLEDLENALQRNEQIEKILNDYELKFVDFREACLLLTQFRNDGYKKLKALEIIKRMPKEEKQILLNTSYTYTKDGKEYELLKEVLL